MYDDMRGNCLSLNKSVNKALSQESNKAFCIVLGSLLLCVVLYVLFIKFNIWGFRNWLDRIDGLPQVQEQVSCVERFEHTVCRGETLWSIADKYYPNKPYREVIWSIRSYNVNSEGRVMDANIFPGQVIRLPMNMMEVK